MTPKPENFAESAEQALGAPRDAIGDAVAGSAERLLGVSSQRSSSPHLGWYSRGYLPHRDHPGLLQFITYRLADSLPAAVLERMEAELGELPPEQQNAARRKQIEEWLDAGHGSCVLRFPEAAACVVDNWRCFAGKRYDLIAWVVMPNHIHVLIRTYEGASLGKIVQSWKSYTSRRIRALMEEEQRRAGAQRSQAVWMREYWDRYIRDEKHFHAAINYIHQNPVKAELVEKAEDWNWSSAREFVERAGNAER
ncbi:MAG: transposase [Blastocatellales bacterium]